MHRVHLWCVLRSSQYALDEQSTWLNDPEEEQEEEGKQLEDEEDDANERERTKQGAKDDANESADVVCGNCARIGWPEVCSLACEKATQEDGDGSKLQQLSTAPKKSWGEELEATVDAFLAIQESASQDRLTDLLAQKLTFATNSDETAQALEMFLLTEVLPANKIVRTAAQRPHRAQRADWHTATQSGRAARKGAHFSGADGGRTRRVGPC